MSMLTDSQTGTRNLSFGRHDKQPHHPPRRTPPRWRKGLGLVIIFTLLFAAVGVAARWFVARTTQDRSLVYYTVERTDLDITVTERGNLESQINELVICEVDDIDGDGISGTPIVWIVENGESVSQGDLVVELDSTMLRDRLDTQILDVEEAKSDFIQAQVQYDNQITQNETNLEEARLQVALAELALKQYEDEDGGTFQIELQDIELAIQEAKAGELIEQTNLKGVEQLYKLGYRSSGELAQARLSALSKERELATSVARRKELVEYQYKRTKMELEGAFASAERALVQVERDNDALLAQAKAKLDAAEESLKKETERLARYREQLKKCKICAPQDGMVAYATGRSRYRREEIRPGAPVRRRQPILSIPNLKRMQVKTSVHESVLDRIQKGQTVSIRVDAFPEMHYTGSVQSVAVLPDQGGWLSSDTKIYPTVVTIDEDVDQLKPGMTAVVEIHVDHLADVLAVPIQAMVQVEDETWCYVEVGGRPERRRVTFGPTNDKFVQILEGLSEGDRVLLNPSAVSRPPSSDGGESQGATDDSQLAAT